MNERQSEIKFQIEMDDSKLPSKIEWYATESGYSGGRPCKGLMVSIYDQTEKSTLKIDLWTKEMLVDEMNRFFAETLMSMADTYSKATSNTEVSDSLKEFAKDFAKKTGVIQ